MLFKVFSKLIFENAVLIFHVFEYSSRWPLSLLKLLAYCVFCCELFVLVLWQCLS